MIRGVAFDIDGTLYPNGRMYRASLGIVARNLRLFRAFGRARAEIRHRRPVKNLHWETAELTARYLDQPVATVAERIESVIYHRWEQVLHRVPLFPGVAALLRDLQRREVPLAAMSDFPVSRKLQILGIQEFWTVAFSSEDVGYLKPNPEPFRELAARMGFSPPEILYVGNSYRYDVLGAAAEGFVTAHLGGSTKNSPAANVVVRSFPDLHRWILEHLDTAKI